MTMRIPIIKVCALQRFRSYLFCGSVESWYVAGLLRSCGLTHKVIIHAFSATSTTFLTAVARTISPSPIHEGGRQESLISTWLTLTHPHDGVAA